MNASPKLRLGFFTLLLIVVCVGISYLTVNLTRTASHFSEDLHAGHHELHQELSLTDSEKKVIEAFESDYQKERILLLEEFNQRIGTLGALLVSHDEWNSDVEHAIHELHVVHGQLQKLSILHYYQMLEVLPPKKQQKLRELAAQALSVPE